MMMQIENELRENGRVNFQILVGKVRAFVAYSPICGITVCVMNASNRAWRGMGRSFRTFSDALNGYKSQEVKQMIEYLQSQVA
jgi:hypothetical protein